jgi:hypothetical protein
MGSLDGDTTDTIHVANNLSNAVYNSNHIRPWSFQTRTNKNENENEKEDENEDENEDEDMNKKV